MYNHAGMSLSRFSGTVDTTAKNKDLSRDVALVLEPSRFDWTCVDPEQ